MAKQKQQESGSQESQSDEKTEAQKKQEAAEKSSDKGAQSEQAQHERQVAQAASEEREKSDGETPKLQNPKDKGYSPYSDPSVPSSAVAEVIVQELGGGKKGKSPTLDACRKAYKDRQDG